MQHCRFLIWLVLLSIWSFAGCEDTPSHEYVAGFGLSKTKFRTNESIGYTVSLPNFSSAHERPLIVFLNGLGENGDDGLSIKNNFGLQVWEMQGKFPFVAVAPQCSKGGSWSSDGEDAQRALWIIKEVQERFNIDSDRIYLTGVSSGGGGALRISSRHSHLFAAVIPLCGAGGEINEQISAGLPVWSFCNDRDESTLVEANRSTIQEITVSGLVSLYTEYHASGHNCWNQAYRNKAIYEWLLQQSRSKNQLESEKFRLIDKEVSVQNKTLSLAGDELLTKSVSDIKPIACGNFYRLIDFHFQSKFVPGQTLALHLESTNSDDQFVLHLPYAVDGPATFMRNSGNVFAYISPRAQNQLDPKGWNDIRLRVEKDRVSVMINGFHALDQPLDQSEIEGWNISLEPSGPADTEMRFRYLRWRPLTWLMSSTN